MTVEVKTGELVQKLNRERQNRGVLSGTTVLNAVAKSMMVRWKNKDIIADYGFSGELKKEPDLRVPPRTLDDSPTRVENARHELS